jgi:hypothetical protein
MGAGRMCDVRFEYFYKLSVFGGKRGILSDRFVVGRLLAFLPNEVDLKYYCYPGLVFTAYCINLILCFFNKPLWESPTVPNGRSQLLQYYMDSLTPY